MTDSNNKQKTSIMKLNLNPGYLPSYLTSAVWVYCTGTWHRILSQAKRLVVIESRLSTRRDISAQTVRAYPISAATQHRKATENITCPFSGNSGEPRAMWLAHRQSNCAAHCVLAWPGKISSFTC